MSSEGGTASGDLDTSAHPPDHIDEKAADTAPLTRSPDLSAEAGHPSDEVAINGHNHTPSDFSKRPYTAILNEEAANSESAARGGDETGPQGEDEGNEVVDADEDEDTDEREEQDDDDDDDDDDEDDEDEDDEDDEPALKYERIGGSLPDLFKKDSASALAISNKLMALGTHSGIVHVLDLSGARVKSFKPHSASIVDMCMDSTGDFIGTASIDGQVVIHSLSTPELYIFDFKRPIRSLALEPAFAKKGSRAFVCGGMAGTLVQHEKGWLGHKETVLHSGEGPVWQVRWRGRLIAWANDMGVKVYDTTSQTRVTFIERQAESPRPDLFKCTLHWQDDSTLLIAWADVIKVARIRGRPRNTNSSATANLPPLIVEITAVFQLDCMIAGIVPHLSPTASTAIPAHQRSVSTSTTSSRVPVPTSLLVVAYSPPDTSFKNEATEDRTVQARKAAERPELRIVSRAGEELAADALTVAGYQSWSCNDYVLAEADPDDAGQTRAYVVLSPRDVILVRPRDRKDHIAWLVERKRYEEALEQLELLEGEAGAGAVDAVEIGQKYIEHLIGEGDFAKAAKLCPKVCGQDVKRWEDWIFVFAQKQHLQAIIPHVPTDAPRLGHLVYEMILAHFLANDRQALQRTIHEWPKDIYDTSAVIVAMQSELDRSASTSSTSPATHATPETVILMECLAELYTAIRQPAKALPFLLRLRRTNVFDLIRENNLFTAVQDQALLLVEFDQELIEKRKKEGHEEEDTRGAAITLLVDHTHSIPIARVVQQLQSRPYFLFLYLDALFEKDPHIAATFADPLVKLYAEYATSKLIDFLRASNYYSLEEAYDVCTERDLVPEMVFLLGRMGNNKKALYLIIDRLGDVNRAIDFAKEQNDDDLWEDLLKYSETRPPFIRGLLENVGAEIDPIRLIRRIKNGLEIPGLKPALIKILHDFNLQISLLDGCQAILNGDSSDLAKQLHRDQSSGFFLTAKTPCPICNLPLQDTSATVALLFLCRHVVHARCAEGGDDLPPPPDPAVASVAFGTSPTRGISGKIAYTVMVRARVTQGCPVCHKTVEGGRR
ncbi:vacuolar assembling protein VPS41 [Auriscalpium vulgare]|uniref:Vacuolar assembling protein VPS41 n=1 Tax=Auriscalpium vulgare TaxID=40419 RepID=A0ACB8SBH9_9AGAM|nr:vacuolar assembling protein VPS41 [Auriscalpium vulgare]